MKLKKISDCEYHVLCSKGSLVAGINLGHYRPWIFPFYSPGGINILREFPPDHGFHNGLFWGHYPLIHRGTEHNFWGTPPFRSTEDLLSKNVGRIDSAIRNYFYDESGITVALTCRWKNFKDFTLCNELRLITIDGTENAASLKLESYVENATEDAIMFRKSKFSGHTYRIASEITHDLFSNIKLNGDAIEIEAVHGSSAKETTLSFGNTSTHVQFTSSEECNYFVRSYGLVSANPFLHRSVTLKSGQKFSYYSKLETFKTPSSTKHLCSIA